MKKFLVAVALALFVLTSAAESYADVYVQGYTRRDGTYVAPHYRSSPNKSYNDNWSVKPNVNPHTGKRGTLSPTFNSRPPSRNSRGGGLNLSPYGRR